MKKLNLDEEITLTNKLIQINKDKVKTLEEKESTIQERYKKMMEDELSSIVREKAERLAAIETLEKMLSKDDAPVVDTKAEEKPAEVVEQPTHEPEQKTEEKQEDKKEEEPVIQDTFFPENNEPEQEFSDDSTSDEAEQKPEGTENDDNVDNSENPEVNDEALHAEVLESTDNSGFVFEDNDNQETNDNAEDPFVDDFPAMPQEWQ